MPTVVTSSMFAEHQVRECTPCQFTTSHFLRVNSSPILQIVCSTRPISISLSLDVCYHPVASKPPPSGHRINFDKNAKKRSTNAEEGWVWLWRRGSSLRTSGQAHNWSWRLGRRRKQVTKEQVLFTLIRDKLKDTIPRIEASEKESLVASYLVPILGILLLVAVFFLIVCLYKRSKAYFFALSLSPLKIMLQLGN